MNIFVRSLHFDKISTQVQAHLVHRQSKTVFLENAGLTPADGYELAFSALGACVWYVEIVIIFAFDVSL